jgi:hypothetical protein
MAIVPSESFHQNTTDSRITVTGLDVDLSALLADAPKLDVDVCADVVRIVGTIALPGRAVTIVARTVVGTDGACLDVSGVDAEDYRPGDRADDGRTPGANGSDGASGRQGQHAGTITVHCNKLAGSVSLVANGGVGGRGQDGGNGAVGARGADGADGARMEDSSSNGQPGQPGGKGGAAGAGGDGGAGGNGGRIVVRRAELEGSLKTSAAAGGGGAPGATGRAGEGGSGGRGGAGFTCWEFNHGGRAG